MSRNKENKPLPSQTRANGSVFGQIKGPPTADFFTDSILDDTSRIPSPSPVKSKNVLSKPRRAFQSARPLATARDGANTANRSSSPSHDKSRARKHLQPAPILTRPSALNHSQRELITPPQSRDGPGDVKSPTSDVSSPPRGLTEVYQRIDDEEELAAADREGGSSEEGSDMGLPIDDHSPIRPIKNGVHRRSESSRGSTPVRLSRYLDKENRLDDITGTLSEGTGVSFLKGLTDQNIAASITPAVSSHLKDMKRLGISTKPITFNPGQKPSEMFANEDLNLEQRPVNAKLRAFSLTGKLNSHRAGKAHSDTSVEERPRPQAFKLTGLASNQPVPPPLEEDDDGNTTPEELRKQEKIFTVSRIAKRIGSRSPEKTDNAVGNNRGLQTKKDAVDIGAANGDATGNFSTDIPRHQPKPSLGQVSTQASMAVTDKASVESWRHAAAEVELQRAPSFTSQASSSVNWGEVDDAMPIHKLGQREGDSPQVSPPRSEAPPSVRSQKSVDRLKRWENDFTGTSFQVSESPPVKSRKNVEDYVRESEIARLSKSAVTTNRLDAIRERDPREAHRRLSRSTSGTSLRKDAKDEELLGGTPLETVGEQIPDTPVVVFRSSSGSQDTPRPSVERPSHDRSTSHDLMQRLARLSTTPKSQTAQAIQEDDITDQIFDEKDELTQDTYPSSANAPEVQDEPMEKKPNIAATPKVTGAWTDTILPNTIKPIKQRENEPPKYAQTPHVNAGGWIETPLPAGTRQSSAMAPMIIEEITEELDTDVGPKAPAEVSTSEQSKEPPVLPVEMGSNEAQSTKLPKSAWASIREQQQLRIASQDITDAAANDTFVLGDATLASLDEALDLTDRDLTDLIRMGAEQEARALRAEAQDGSSADTDTQQIGRLFSKLHTLQTNIHTARKGISKLEKEVAKDPTTASFLQQDLYELVAHLPRQAVASFSPSSLFVPLLFDPPKEPSRLRPFGKPTRLGYSVLSVLMWYLLECLLSELFCHPLIADRYSWPSHAFDEPQFGLVMPALALRSVGVNRIPNFGAFGEAVWVVLGPVYTLLRAFYRIVAMWIGWTDGFVDDVREIAVRNASQAIQKVAETVGGLTMDEDEFI